MLFQTERKGNKRLGRATTSTSGRRGAKRSAQGDLHSPASLTDHEEVVADQEHTDVVPPVDSRHQATEGETVTAKAEKETKHTTSYRKTLFPKLRLLDAFESVEKRVTQ